MNRVEKDGRAERIERPKTQRETFLLPYFTGVEIDLETQERGPKRQACFKDKGQPPAGDELAQPVERKHQDGDPGQVDGGDGAFSLPALPAVDAELQPGVILFRIEMKVIVLGIVVGEVDIAVPAKTVGGERVIGFVAGEGW